MREHEQRAICGESNGPAQGRLAVRATREGSVELEHGDARLEGAEASAVGDVSAERAFVKRDGDEGERRRLPGPRSTKWQRQHRSV
jgi:hypothetical protein